VLVSVVGSAMSCSVAAMTIRYATSSLRLRVVAIVCWWAPDSASWTAAHTVSTGLSRSARLFGSPLAAQCCGWSRATTWAGSPRASPHASGGALWPSLSLLFNLSWLRWWYRRCSPKPVPGAQGAPETPCDDSKGCLMTFHRDRPDDRDAYFDQWIKAALWSVPDFIDTDLGCQVG